MICFPPADASLTIQQKILVLNIFAASLRYQIGRSYNLGNAVKLNNPTEPNAPRSTEAHRQTGKANGQETRTACGELYMISVGMEGRTGKSRKGRLHKKKIAVL